MPYITISGLQYYYEAALPAGKEPLQAVLFVHGAGGSSRHWLYQLQGLGKKYMALAVDLPGHGQSGGKARDSIEQYSEFISEFANKLLGMPFFLGGHSMGGAISMDYALNYPDRLAGLILIGTGSRLKVKPELLEAFKNGIIIKDMVNFLYSPGTPDSILEAAGKEISSVEPGVFYNDFYACDNFNIDTLLEQINTPTLVVSAENDVMTPVKYGKHLQNNINNAILSVLPAAGHMMMVEKPGQLNEIIDNFISSNLKQFASEV